MSNKEWLDKCLIAADKLYSIFPFEVFEEMYGEPLDKEAAIEAARGKLDFVDSNLDDFEALGYGPGYFTPTQYEDVVITDETTRDEALHASEDEIEFLLYFQGDRPFYIPTKQEIISLAQKGNSFKNGKLATFTQPVIACSFLNPISISVSSYMASSAVLLPSAIMSRYLSMFSLNLFNSRASKLLIKLLYVFIGVSPD